MTNFLLGISDKITSRNLKNKLIALQHFERLSVEDKKSWISEHLYKICLEASDTIPFYVNHFKDVEFKRENFDFENLPYIDKNDLKEYGRHFRRSDLGSNLFYCKTNGSTGGRVTITYDKEAADWSAAVMLYCRKKAGHGFLQKQMHIATSNNNPNKIHKGKWRQYIKDILNRRFNLYVSDLNKTSIIFYLETIKAQKPHLISGMPSHIYYIAEYILKNNISVYVDLIELTGESCSRKQIEVIKNAFGGRVLNRYGLAEAGIVSYTFNSDDRMNVIDRHTYVELTEDGEIVITCLNNMAMPLIRYKTGDFVDKENYTDACPMSLPLITGRTHRYANSKAGIFSQRRHLKTNYSKAKSSQMYNF